jgi:hypothetical protein
MPKLYESKPILIILICLLRGISNKYWKQFDKKSLSTITCGHIPLGLHGYPGGFDQFVGILAGVVASCNYVRYVDSFTYG